MNARVVAWAMCAATLALLAAGTVLSILEPREATEIAGDPVEGNKGYAVGLLTLAGFTLWSLLAAFLATRRPRNPIAWFLCLTPLCFAINGTAFELYWYLQSGPPGDEGAADLLLWLAAWTWVPAVVPLFTFLPLLFPDGRFQGPRWRKAGIVAGAAGAGMALGAAFMPGPFEDYGWTDNPVGIPGFPGEALTAIAFFVWLVVSVVSVASLVLRYRRSHGVERQQLRLVLAAAAFLVLTFIVSGLASEAGLLDEDGGWVALLIALLVLPSSMAVAILRHRLYELDVVINRTLVYGALTATLAAAYLGIVLLLQVALAPLTESSDLAIAGSTLAVAALARPARGRIQGIVDRRFYRRRYNAASTIQSFGARLRDEIELDSLSTELRGVVSETMQPAHVSLWLRKADA